MTGRALRRLRKARGLSVAKAAAEVKVSSRTWTRWEAGTVPPPIAKLIGLLWGNGEKAPGSHR